jgi:Sap, sulfolipid-1-addressing protein
MWGAVLVFALSAMGDPLRIAIAVLLCSRPRPVVNLFMFWLGGIATSLVVGLVALFVLRDFSLMVMRGVASTAEDYNVALIQTAVGVLALLIASLIAGGFLARQRAPVAVSVGNLSALAIERGTPAVFARLSTRARDALKGGSPRVAFLGGIWAAPGPPIELTGALAAILASGAAAGAQVAAVILYSLVAFGIVSIPLVCHLVAPAKSQAIMLRVDSWVRARRRPLFAIILAVVGAYLVATGVDNI